MTDLVLRDLPPGLAARIRKLAELQGRSVHEVMAEVLEAGVHACEVKLRKQLDLEEETALKHAIAALEQVPDDAGFGLIGRI
jgi:plasmid stability protein